MDTKCAVVRLFCAVVKTNVCIFRLYKNEKIFLFDVLRINQPNRDKGNHGLYFRALFGGDLIKPISSECVCMSACTELISVSV